MPLYSAEELQAPFGSTPQGYPAGYEATPNESRPVFETVGEQPMGEAQPSTVRRRKPDPSHTLGATTRAAFSIENEVAGAWSRINEERQYGPYDPGHNPYDTIKGTELEPFAWSFVGSANQKQTDIIAQRIRDELKSRKVLEESGWAGTAMSMVASLASPTTLLPGGAFYRSARAGQAALRSAASVGAWNAGATVIQEAALQSQQYTRSLTESGLAVGGAAILGGILGAGVSGVSSRRFIAMSRALDDELRLGQEIGATIAEREARGSAGGVGAARLDEVAIGGSGQGASAGAASTKMPDLEVKGAFGVENAVSFSTPSGRLMSSPFPTVREIAGQTIESPLAFTRNAEGYTTAPRGGSIETRVKTQGIARLGQAIDIANEQWMKHRFGQSVAVPGMRHMLDRGSGKLSEREFRNEISKAMRRGDQHDIPEVAAAAKAIRKQVIDPIADAAIKQKMLDPEVVAKGRPRGGAAGGTPAPKGPDEGGPGGGLAADPVARAGAEDLLRQFEGVSGLKLDDVSRKAAVDFLLSDNDAMRQIRSLLGLDGDVPFPALAEAASRQARAEFNEIAQRLDRGETVTMPPDHVAAHYQKLGPILDEPWVNADKVGVISEIRPIGGGLVEIFVRTGRDKLVKLPGRFRQAFIESARAFHYKTNGFTVFSRLYGVGSVSEKALGGELRHEHVHTVWGGLGREVRDRLVAHGEKLRVLDYDSRSYFDVVDVPGSGASVPSGRTLRDAYEDLYISTHADYKPLGKFIVDADREAKDLQGIIAQLDGKQPSDRALLLELQDQLSTTRANIRDAHSRMAKIEAAFDAKVGEEAVAHMVEMHYHGLLSDADIAPVRADLDSIFGGMRTADQDAIERLVKDVERGYESMDGVPVEPQVMFALADRDAGRAMRRDLDQLGYYSKAIEAAKGLRQAKGTPEQMLAQLKAAGVKDAEIEATKLGGLLRSPDPTAETVRLYHGTTPDGLRGINESGVVRAPAFFSDRRNNAASYGSEVVSVPVRKTDLMIDADLPGGRLLSVADANGYLDNPGWSIDDYLKAGRYSFGVEANAPLSGPQRASITRDDIVKHLEENRVGLTESVYERGAALGGDGKWRAAYENTKWSPHSLDPTNPTYRETVLHLPDAQSAAQTRMESARQRMDVAAYESAKADLDAIIASNGKTNDFRSGHFPEPNITGHMMTSMTSHQGRPVYTIDQIQSDWGQKLRDGGVRDEAKIKRLTDDLSALPAYETAHDAVMNKFAEWGIGDPRWPTAQIVDVAGKNADAAVDLGRMSAGDAKQFKALADSLAVRERLDAELWTAQQGSSGHPLVNTTDQWTNTTLRRAVRQAAEADAEFIAIPSGKTVLSYNPGDTHGMAEFYDKIVPKNLRNILQKLDKNSPAPEHIATLDSPSGKTGLGEGFTLFRLTDEVKRTVMEDGQPMFALGRFGFELDRSRIQRMRQRERGDLQAELPRQVSEIVEPYLKASRAAESAGLGVERDASGQIASVMRDGKRYTITRDADGNVAGIAEAPDQGARSFSVQRGEDGAAQGLDEASMLALQEQANAVRESLTKTLTQAVSRMGIKGVKPEMVDGLSQRLMEAAQKALYDGLSPEAAIARTLQDAIDPAGTLQGRIMAAIGEGRDTASAAASPGIKTLSDVEQWRARQIMREIEMHAADMKAAEAGGGDVFSKEVGDRIWDDGGQTYLHRVWDRVKVLAGRPRLVEIITQHFEGGQRRAQSELKTILDDVAATGKPASAKIAKEIENLQQFVGLSRQELRMNAELTVDHILGAAEGRLVNDLPNGVRGALKARTLRIADALVEDFLENDINVVMRHYVHSMVSDIETKRMFGSLTMEEQIAKINEEAALMMSRAETESDRIALGRMRDSNIKDLQAMVDRLRGTYKLPDDPMSWGPRVVRGLKDFNYVSKLGGMVIAALSDPFRAMMTHGVTAYFRDGVVPLMRGLKGLKLAGDELRLAGAAWDMTLNTRGAQLADVMDDYGRYSKFERGLGWMSDKFGNLTLMNQWNVALKTFSGTIVMNNIIRDAIAVAKGSNSVIERLAAAGIDAADARVIAEQFGKHGEIVDGVYLANTKAWDATPNTQNALEAFRGAVVRDVDRIIVTPGVGDKPLFASTQVGGLIFQFKSFGFASMERTLIAGLQQRDAGVLMGAMLMVGMGAVSEYLKATVNKKDLPKTNAMWVAAAVDRSGLLAWLPEVNHAMEQWTGGQLGVAKLTGKELSRYASRNWADSVLGPSFGLMADLVGVTSGISRTIAGKERLRESDIAALRRMLPMNNLFYLSYLFQSLEQSAAQALGAQPSTRRITPGR